MSVIGFDIGNENCVIAAVKQGGIDVLLNDKSNCETPAVVCFGEKQRFLGYSGAAFATMNPNSTITQLKRLIGRHLKDPLVQKELQMLPFETSESPADGVILIHLKYLGETVRLTPTEIMAMLFSHLKDLTEKKLEMQVVECVIGIPSYFTDLQRRAYLDAAAIAGLKPLRLIHDCTATALSYGIYRTDFCSAGPTFVAFVDVGHCDTQVSIVSFEAGNMRVLSHAFDSCLGGRDFDEILFGYFAEQFKKSYSIDVYSNIRACIRLRAACEKLKRVLSENAEALLDIECLMDEKDVKGFIKREEFESLASELLERFSIPANKALADAGLPFGKIHSVELVGSGSRIPAITKLTASVFGRKPSRKLNASECVARGCALQCAILSRPVFGVREYEVQDSFPFSIGVSSNEGLVSSGPNDLRFPKGQHFPSIKILTLQRSYVFALEAYYANTNELPPGPAGFPKITDFIIGPFHDTTTVEIKVELNLHGIVTVTSAMSIEDHIETDKKEFGSYIFRWGPEIPVMEIIYGRMCKAEVSEAQEKELRWAEHDRSVEHAKGQINSLESYVYEMRNKFFNTHQSIASEKEREVICRSLQETEEWLYEEDGDDDETTENAYASKLQYLQKLVDPIELRFKDECQVPTSSNLE